jgi:hypothetical protein
LTEFFRFSYTVSRVPGIMRHVDMPLLPRGANSLVMRPSEAATLSCYVKAFGLHEFYYNILWRKNGEQFVHMKMTPDDQIPREFHELCTSDGSRQVLHFGPIRSDQLRFRFQFSEKSG